MSVPAARASALANQKQMEQADQQWALQNRALIQDVMQKAAQMPDFQSAQQFLASEIQGLQESGVKVPERFSAQTFTPETFEQIKKAFPMAEKPGFTLAPGATRFDAAGNPIATNPKAEEQNRSILQRIMPDGEIQTVQGDRAGRFYDMEGKPISLSALDRVVSSSLTGSLEEVGIGDAEATQLRNAEVATKGFIATAQDALQMLKDAPDINTFLASGAGIVNNITQEARALARAAGTDIDGTLLDSNTYDNDFKRLGIDSVRMRSLLTSLAYHQALANNPDGRVSNADLSRAIAEIGASSSDPATLSQTLVDVANRTVRNFNINYETRMGKPYDGNLGEGVLRPIQGDQAAIQRYIDQGLSPEEAQELWELENK